MFRREPEHVRARTMKQRFDHLNCKWACGPTLYATRCPLLRPKVHSSPGRSITKQDHSVCAFLSPCDETRKASNSNDRTLWPIHCYPLHRQLLRWKNSRVNCNHRPPLISHLPAREAKAEDGAQPVAN